MNSNQYDFLKKNIQDISENCSWGNYYGCLGLPKGLCYGMAAMWGQAHLANDRETFYQRLEFLTRDFKLNPYKIKNCYYTKLSEIINFICLFEKKVSKEKPVGYANLYRSIHIDSKDYDIFISLRSFLDGLLAYHSSHTTFLNQPEYDHKGQNILNGSKYVLNKEVSKQNTNDLSALIEIYNFPIIGQKEEYQNFFRSLKNNLCRFKFNHYILVSSIDHAISLSILDNNIAIYDINYLSKKSPNKSIKDKYIFIDSLEEEIFNLFNFNIERERDNLLTLNISIYTNQAQYNIFKRYDDNCFEKKLKELRKDLLKKLRTFLISCSMIKQHKNRALNAYNKLSNLNFNIESFIKEEYISLAQTDIKKELLSYFNIHSQYQKIIKEAKKDYDQIYKDHIIIKSHFNKNLLEYYISKEYHIDTDYFWMACSENHTKLVELLLRNNIQVNKPNSLESSAISGACSAGHFEIVELLIQNGADINKANKYGATPMLIASNAGHFKIVELLLKNNADANRSDISGHTPIIKACYVGHINIVRLFLEKKPFLKNIADKIYDNTPIMYASYMGHTKIVELLIQNGADINKLNKIGDSALSLAIDEGYLEIINLLKKA